MGRKLSSFIDAELDNEYQKLSKHMSHKYFRFNANLYALVKIPSSADHNIKYDVLIEITGGVRMNPQQSIMDVDVRVASNSPSFMYYHAYNLNKEGAVITICMLRVNRKSITNKPRKRSSNKPDKSLALAAQYLSLQARDKISNIKAGANFVGNPIILYFKLMPGKTIMGRRRSVKKEEPDKNTAKGTKQISDNRRALRTPENNEKGATVSNVATSSKRTPVTNKTKSVKGVKRHSRRR